MPVVDGLLIPDTLDKLMKNPLPIDYMLGFTNADMYAPFLAYIGRRFGKQNGAYLYYFDLDAPGDDNRAFHSSDLRYMFETLDGSWRPYGARDHEAAAELASYLTNFARSGDPNGPGLPRWSKAEKGVLRIAPGGTKMGHVNYWKLTRNFLRRPDPKA
jgi:para-nitrobenzyl esterase